MPGDFGEERLFGKLTLFQDRVTHARHRKSPRIRIAGDEQVDEPSLQALIHLAWAGPRLPSSGELAVSLVQHGAVCLLHPDVL